jgi:hypothetical protein
MTLALGAPPSPRAATASSDVCSREEARTLVRSVLLAFNRGDAVAFNALIAQRPTFKWFSVSGRPGRRVRAAAFDRAGLPRYVERRHAMGERQRLVRFRFNGRSGGFGHFDFSVVRSARDHPPKPVTGKGAVSCALERPLIAVWSLGGV